MDWVQTLSIMATVIASAYYIHREIQADIKATNSRTDRLYELYCEAKSDGDQKLMEMQKNMDQKFYDLLKEGRK